MSYKYRTILTNSQNINRSAVNWAELNSSPALLFLKRREYLSAELPPFQRGI